MRLFVAAYPPPAAVEHLAAAIGELHVVRVAARVSRVDTWHVTLAFLGEVPAERLPVAADAVSLAAQVTAPLRLRVAGGGSFGRGRTSVLWAGLAGAVPELVELAGATRRALGRARLPYDRKPVRPHLTLARPGERVPGEQLAQDVAVLDGYRGPEWTLDRILLVSSELGPVPRYQVVHEAALSPSDSAAGS